MTEILVTFPIISACLLLIYSACRFLNFDIERHGVNDFFTNERLMLVHTVIFSFFTVMSILRQIVAYYQFYFSSAEDYQNLCIVIKVYIPVKTLSMLASISTLLLFIYMTSEFSRPMTQYWQKFLLVYQSAGPMGAARISRQLEESRRAHRYN